MTRLFHPSAVALALGACTPSGSDGSEPPTATAPMPPVDLDGAGESGEQQPERPCALRFGEDPIVIAPSDLQPSPIGPALAWSKKVDARGGYAHRVGMDAEGGVVWAHDIRSMSFVVASFRRDGVRRWRHRLRPAQLEPDVLAVMPDGSVAVSGTAFTTGRRGGQTTVVLDAKGIERWRQRTPRIAVEGLATTADGHLLMLGSSGRTEVTLGEHTMVNERSPGSMEIVARLDGHGRDLWSKAGTPGALDMVVHDGAMVLAAHVGREPHEYWGGTTQTPGVLVSVDGATGEPRWSLGFDIGLWAVRPYTGDLLAVGFHGASSLGGPVLDGTSAAWIDPQGCYRGSVNLGTNISRVDVAPDGSMVVAGVALTHAETRRVGQTSFEVPAGHWFVAGIDPLLQLRWLYLVQCDGLELAAGDGGRAALSCFTDQSRASKLVRRYELLVVDG